nr:MAG TPA: hypothetical protein [Caudoviricetes sp.]
MRQRQPEPLRHNGPRQRAVRNDPPGADSLPRRNGSERDARRICSTAL